jgi:glycosyltransferase involved in cell wall biosynthesis
LTVVRVGYYLADQNPQRDRTLGITTYTAALLGQLQGGPNFTISALQSRSSFVAPAPVHRRFVLPFRTDRPLGRLLGDQIHPLVAKLEVDLWHYPKGFLPLALRYPGPIVGTVCDVILQHYADHYPRARSAMAYAYWLFMLKRAIPRFDLILTISEFSRERIIEFAERNGIHCPPILVTYLASEWAVGGESAKGDFLLHLASREPHKRTSTLLNFWREIETRGAVDLQLELVGSLTNADEKVACSLKSVRVSKRLSQAELRGRFLRARAVILPSEIEGFGLPALEAYAAKTPVMYVTGTAVEEILGAGTPGGFNLSSFDSFQGALEEVLRMTEGAINAKAQALQRRFSWSKCAVETLAAYESLL